MKVICGTDFSGNATTGTTIAALLAQRLHDRLLLVHALPPGHQGAGAPEPLDPLSVSHRKKLSEEIARLCQLCADVEPCLATGSPDGVIVDKAVPSETRLVVLSSPGRLVSHHRLLVGVAERVA